jgi:hypothetical protein
MPTCLNSQINFVSQSIKGTVTGSSTVVINETKHVAMTSFDITEQMDMERWNYRSELSIPSVKVRLENRTEDLKIELRFLLMAPQKKVVVWHRLTNNTSGKEINQNCTAKTFSVFPTPQQLSAVFELSKRVLQKCTKCNGNDGTYDKWIIAQVRHDGFIPYIPGFHLPNGSAFVYSVTNAEMDKAYLVHSALASIDIEMDLHGKGSASTKDSTNLTVSHATLGGPTASDLDYSKLGSCHNSSFELDIDTLFQPAPGSEASRVLSKINTQGFFQKQILTTIKDSQPCPIKDSLKSTVVV